jgi:riboflavin biosynthesis pyrimidine reductase
VIAPLDPRELIAGLELRAHDHEARPHVAAAMIASADGRAAVAGRSVGLGHPADRELLRGLRAEADAVLVGPATMRAERYRALLDPEHRAARLAAGRPAAPLIATITRRGDVPWEVGLFAEPEARVAIHSAVPVRVPADVAAQVTVSPVVDLAGVLAELHRLHDARAVLCEGGPTLLRAVAAAGLLDELLLTVAPLLVAGEGVPAPLAGPALEPPVGMALQGAWRADDHVVLHYRPRR